MFILARCYIIASRSVRNAALVGLLCGPEVDELLDRCRHDLQGKAATPPKKSIVNKHNEPLRSQSVHKRAPFIKFFPERADGIRGRERAVRDPLLPIKFDAVVSMK